MDHTEGHSVPKHHGPVAGLDLEIVSGYLTKKKIMNREINQWTVDWRDIPICIGYTDGILVLSTGWGYNMFSSISKLKSWRRQGENKLVKKYYWALEGKGTLA